MKKLINKSIRSFYSYSQLILSGALVFGVFQFPSLSQPIFSIPSNPQSLSVTQNNKDTPLKGIFFGNTDPSIADSIVDKQIAFVSSRDAFPASLAVIEKHVDTIKKMAQDKGVPEDVAIGVSLLENGGSDTAKSPAGALGVFQLMPGTARSLGLTVNKKVDQRKDPEANIEAGITYLRQNFDRFGDWGLATWAYHAGEGNVAKALSLYAKANGGQTFAKADWSAMKDYVQSHGITVHKLLSSSAVQTFTKKLNDDSAGYPYKVIATATLFKQASSGGATIPGNILGNL